MTVKNKKLILFGAGKIGRSFIGQLFSRGGYEVVFIDVYKPVIDEINRRKNYNVIIKSDKEEVINIKNIRGVYAGDEIKVVDEVATAGIVAVSVGLNGLSSIFPLLAKGLQARLKTELAGPLDIIIAENMRNADNYFHTELEKLLPADFPFDQMVGLIETSIGKMVPIMQKKDIEEDMLQIFAEPYNTLILNRKAFKNPIPEIKGLAPRDNMKAWVDRKLFIHNLGHAAAAYIGHLSNPRFIYIYEALAQKDVYDRVLAAMVQSAGILLKKYPDEFTAKDLNDHIEDLLERFQNKALGDTLFRVGCDLMRKLGPEDRLAGAIRSAIDNDLPYDKILFALVCGCHFRAKDESGNLLREDKDFIRLYGNDVRSILINVCIFEESTNNKLFREAAAINDRLVNKLTGSDVSGV
jgi:mannitol-1-phosphate 5-dehydrogenase